jgi:predicted flap endonuclease-1-like 5' DNA nuclease
VSGGKSVQNRDLCRIFPGISGGYVRSVILQNARVGHTSSMDGVTPQIVAYLVGTAVLGIVLGWLTRAVFSKGGSRGSNDATHSKPDGVVRQKDESNAKIASLQATMNMQQSLVHKLESSVAGSRAELEPAYEKADLLAKDILTLREERENTKLQLSTMQRALVSVKQQTLTLQTEFVKVGEFYKGELRKSFAKRQALEAQVEAARSERVSAAQLLKSSRSEQESIDEMLDSAQVQLLQLGVLERNVGKLEDENEQLSENVKRMRIEIEALEREQGEVKALKIHNKELTRCLESMETSRRKHEDDAERFKESAGEAEKKSDTLRLKLEDLQSSFAEIEAQQEEVLHDVRETTAPPPEGADDLKKILGIGKVFESTLHDLGIYSYQQIAAFGLSDIARVNSQLKEFKGRMEQDDWIGQAKDLHLKKYGEAV